MHIDREWLEKIPKVELHVHLGGAIPLPTLKNLIGKYQGDVPTDEQLAQKFSYRDFPHFLEIWRWKDLFLREYTDFELISRDVARDLLSQNIKYAEMFFSPTTHRLKKALDTQRLIAAVRRGLDRESGIAVKLIIDLSRNLPPEAELETVEALQDLSDLGVIGIGLGGPELEYPPKIFKKIFTFARRIGLHVTAHAGEGAGPESVWEAIKELEIERVGHAARAHEDEALVEYLKEHDIPVELCPISNIKTRVINTLADHPVRMFFDKGMRLSVNTDDPKLFNTSLAGEYDALANQFDFGKKDIRAIILSAIKSSWLREEEQECLTAQFRTDKAWL